MVSNNNNTEKYDSCICSTSPMNQDFQYYEDELKINGSPVVKGEISSFKMARGHFKEEIKEEEDEEAE